MKTLLNIFALIAVVGSSFIIWAILGTPKVNDITGCVVTHTYKIKLCAKNENYVNLQKINTIFKNLVIISEDASFYSHRGFDFAELKNSFSSNMSTKRIARGGSTITQQLAKNVFLPFDKTLTRKIREAILANNIEHILTKDQILEKYLNVIEFGPNIYGITAAAKFYFSKRPADLNLLESAFLTYLIPNPKVYHRVYTNKKLTPYSRFRILALCYRMYRFQKILLGQYYAAREYVDQFPWKDLTAWQNNNLNGILTITDPDYSDMPSQPSSDEPIPEFDSTVDYVEPSLDELDIPDDAFDY
ncbi:MAG: hypothetical protein A2Z20_08030 [Bdellovibrionales bacterium RBG_16_40_8]|nr:MAG: hypothetical protein A2Z20_08030 [Bdellovibrionales bacterium RBG_16_40_8]